MGAQKGDKLASRKMFPAGAPALANALRTAATLRAEASARRKNPPPPKLTALLEVKHEIEVLALSCDVLLDGVLLEFSTETRFIGMTAAGARQLAATLLKRAKELEDRNG